MRFSRVMWACSLAALPWLRGIPAEAFFRTDSPPENLFADNFADSQERRDARLASSETASEEDLEPDVGSFTSRPNSDEVRVSFSVRGRDGRAVLGVNQQDLQLYENTVPVHQITAFERNLETPRRMAVLLDGSGATQNEFAGLKLNLLEAVSEVVRPGTDEAMFASFNGHGLNWLTPFTDSIEKMRSAIFSVKPQGPIALFDSLVEITADQHWRAPGKPRAQRVLILVTDGEDRLSSRSLQDAITAVTDSNYYVYAFVLNPHRSQEGLKNLHEITGATGGRVFEITAPTEVPISLEKAFATVDEDLRAQYSIAYQRPSIDSRTDLREISIIPSNNHWVIRSRPGYIARQRESTEAGYTLRSNVNEVRLAFSATDLHGRRIKSLNAADVAVVDNGTIIRKFRSFQPATESPVNLVILLDASDSVASRVPAEIEEVKRLVSETHWGERDRVSILTFGGVNPKLLCARSCTDDASQLKLNQIRSGGFTPLYDALRQAAEILAKEQDPDARPAMILFSDGLDTISMHSEADAIAAAQNVQAAIYTVNSRGRRSCAEGDATLYRFARVTGGLSFPPEQNISETLAAVIEDLHSGFVLTYELPPHSTAQHSVQMLPIADPRLQLRSRQGYRNSENN